MADLRSPTLRATAQDLPAAVARALAEPSEPTLERIAAAGLQWASRSWGDSGAAPVLLVHGVTSDGGTFWRIGPAIAASGRRVVAVDLPGHGLTGGWRGRHRFRETAEDLAAFIAAAGLDEGPGVREGVGPGESRGIREPVRRGESVANRRATAPSPVREGLAVLGHSWGGMVTAALPSVGLRPARLILLDPPALPVAALEAMTHDPQEQRYPDPKAAFAATRRAEPLWSDGDVRAKAEALTRFEVDAVRSILVENGDWDAGLADLPVAVGAGIPVWVIRGEEQCGGMIPEALVPRLEDLVGQGHVLTIADAPHSPHRLCPEATVLAILRALAG